MAKDKKKDDGYGASDMEDSEMGREGYGRYSGKKSDDGMDKLSEKLSDMKKKILKEMKDKK